MKVIELQIKEVLEQDLKNNSNKTYLYYTQTAILKNIKRNSLKSQRIKDKLTSKEQ